MFLIEFVKQLYALFFFLEKIFSIENIFKENDFFSTF